MPRTRSSKKSRRGGSRRGQPLNKWQRSEAFKEVGRAALRAVHAKRHLLPKCGATAKSTGVACRQFAMKNGRCYVHGGKTGSGDQWHILQPTGDPVKDVAKLIKSQKSAKARDRKIAALTLEERGRLADWARAHRPGPAGERRRQKEWRRQNEDARATIERSMNAPPKPEDPEVARLSAEIARLRALQAQIAAETNTAEGTHDNTNTIFAPAAPEPNGDELAAENEPGFPYPMKGVFA